MKEKFQVSLPLECVNGHLRYGHLEIEVEADSIQDVKQIIKNDVQDFVDSMELYIDDYYVNNYSLSKSQPFIISKLHGTIEDKEEFYYNEEEEE